MPLDSTKVTLNIFSNCSEVEVEKIPIKQTLKSFFDVFSKDDVASLNFFIHQHPFPRSYQNLYRYIKSFCDDYGQSFIYHTYSLAFGYKKSVVHSTTEYAFQLEHDWRFSPDSIAHSLPALIEAMRAGQMEHLRFNKGANVTGVCDLTLDQTEAAGIAVCRTPCRSNNPHLIHIPAYIDRHLHLIDTSRGTSKGIEENLWGVPHSYIYGPLGYPATVFHDDGRLRLRKIAKKIGKPAYNFLIRNGWMESAFEAEAYLKGKLKRA